MKLAAWNVRLATLVSENKIIFRTHVYKENQVGARRSYAQLRDKAKVGLPGWL